MFVMEGIGRSGIAATQGRWESRLCGQGDRFRVNFKNKDITNAGSRVNGSQTNGSGVVFTTGHFLANATNIQGRDIA
jgi:hypothetical protein